MKLLMIVNKQKKSSSRYKKERIIPILNAQMDNSLSLGWDIKNIILLTNFDYSFKNVVAQKIDFTDNCLTGSKMYGVSHCLKNNLCDDLIWAKDIDAFQNIWFDAPVMKDVGICPYSSSKYNGGSVFWKKTSEDIVDVILNEIQKGKFKEEPTINKILKSEGFKKRVTVLNSTWNVGCSGYYPRALRALKPIRVCHLNPFNTIAWQTHRLDRDGMGMVSVSARLEHILRKYFPNLAHELSEEGKTRSIELRRKHLAKVY